jgi:hypothetical protein
MKKCSLLLALIALNGSAIADWVQIGTHENAIFYADPSTIRRAGDTVSVRSVWDFVKAEMDGDNPFMSVKRNDEFDCAKKAIRQLEVYGYAGAMGQGKQVWGAVTPDNWASVKPGGTFELTMNFACSSR